MNQNHIGSLKTFACRQLIHPIPILELTGIMHPITTAIPRLNANKRRVFRRRRPQPHHRSREAQREIGILLLVQQIHLVDLAILQDKGIYIKRMYIEWQQALRIQWHGAYLIAYTPFLG